MTDLPSTSNCFVLELSLFFLHDVVGWGYESKEFCLRLNIS